MDETAGAPVKCRHFRISEITIRVDDLGYVSSCRELENTGTQRCVRIRAERIDVFDDQRDIVSRSERAEVDVDENIDTFARHRSTDKQKNTAPVDLERRSAVLMWMKDLRIDSKRNDVHRHAWKAGVNILLSDVRAVTPDVVNDISPVRPRLRQRAVLTRLNLDVGAVWDVGKRRRPTMPNRDIRRLEALGTKRFENLVVSRKTARVRLRADRDIEFLAPKQRPGKI